jgi:hypothetical protein
MTVLDQQEMTGGRDRQELGEALDDAEKHDREPFRHEGSSRRAMRNREERSGPI